MLMPKVKKDVFKSSIAFMGEGANPAWFAKHPSRKSWWREGAHTTAQSARNSDGASTILQRRHLGLELPHSAQPAFDVIGAVLEVPGYLGVGQNQEPLFSNGFHHLCSYLLGLQCSFHQKRSSTELGL